MIDEVAPAVEGQGIIYRLSENGRRAVAMELETRLMPEEGDEPLEAYWASRAACGANRAHIRISLPRVAQGPCADLNARYHSVHQ